MNKLFKLFTLFAFFAIMFASCSPDEYGLGRKDVKPEDLVEGIAFKIEHDAANPNIIYLTSLMSSEYTPLWDHPQGRSQKQKVTLKMPFAGTYQVKFGVETRGGIVYGEPVTFTIDEMYAGFIEDEMWTMIAGGAGKSKTWYLDLDAEKVSRHFLGPIYFFTNTYTWDNLHTASGDNYLDADAWNWKNAITPLAGDDGNALWYWLSDWPGNNWICDAADFGTMTFDLIGGANINVDQQAYGLGTAKGSYLISTEEHTISFTDAYPVHDSNRDGEMKAATGFQILYLSENFMQIMVLPSGTCYNYISKDYKDNWVPSEVEEEPPYDGNANEDLTTSVSSSKVWISNLDAPYNWASLKGIFKNEWIKNASGIPVFSTWEPPYDAKVLSKLSIKLTKDGNSAGSYEVVTGSGNSYTGTYSIDEKNWIDFGKDIEFISNLGGWVNIATDGGKMRIISTEKDALGNIKVLHLGRINPSNATEYITLSLVQSAT